MTNLGDRLFNAFKSDYTFGHLFDDIKNVPGKLWDVSIKPEHRGKDFAQLTGEFGEKLRGDILRPTTAFTGGLMGSRGRGITKTVKDETGYSDLQNAAAKQYEDFERFKQSVVGKLPKTGDTKSLIDIDIPKFPEIKFPDINIPEIKFPEITMPDIVMPAISMPDISIGGGIPSLTDDEGSPNPMILIAMAAIGYIVLKKV